MTYIYIFLNIVARFQQIKMIITRSSWERGLHLQKRVISDFSCLL